MTIRIPISPWSEPRCQHICWHVNICQHNKSIVGARVYLEGVWCGLSTRWFHLRWFHLCAVHMLFLRWFHLRWFRLFAVHMLFLRWFRLRWFRLFAVHMLSTRWFHFGREVISLLDVTSTSHAYIIIVSIQSIFQMPLTTPLRHKKLKFKLVNNGVRRLNAVGCDFSQVYMLCHDAFQRGVRCLYIKNWRCVIWGDLCPLGVHEVISFEVISPLCCPHDNLGCFWGDFVWGDFVSLLSTRWFGVFLRWFQLRWFQRRAVHKIWNSKYTLA